MEMDEKGVNTSIGGWKWMKKVLIHQLGDGNGWIIEFHE